MNQKKKILPKEIPLPQIRLKYYGKKPPKQEKPSGITCEYCFEPNIDRIGGGFFDEKGKQYVICERCAIWDYRDRLGFRTLTAAKARRRRIFDTGYLFNEMVIERYLEARNLPSFFEYDPSKVDDLFIRAGELYNYLFSKEEKNRLEELEHQADIEKEFSKALGLIDFKKW